MNTQTTRVQVCLTCIQLELDDVGMRCCDCEPHGWGCECFDCEAAWEAAVGCLVEISEKIIKELTEK